MRAHVKSSFGSTMIGPAGNFRVYLACGVTDMRKGFDTLAAQMQTLLKFDPHNGGLYAFCGRREAGGHSIGCTLNNTKEKQNKTFVSDNYIAHYGSRVLWRFSPTTALPAQLSGRTLFPARS
jgi:biotin carboxylase